MRFLKDRLRLAALFSGGKDSVYSIYLAQQYGWDVACSVVMVPERDDSHMFHVPNIALAPKVSEAMGIAPKVFRTSGEEERELDGLERALSNLDVDGVLTGAIASDYQWSRIHKVCHKLGLRAFSPLWRKSQERVVREELAAGFEIIITGVFAEGLGQDLLGDRLSEDAISKMSNIKGLNIAGEGGEYETLVLDGPNFLQKVAPIGGTVEWSGSSGTIRYDGARLVPRTRSA
ncbi:MAG: diphthine--ammonia ligase [Euryarchaeota archaeon]|nr:diphthine--ammonia ligase [Euryarchaeota archaeon]